MWVHDLRDADASCGGKAIGLARLIRAGLPVPAGFVIDDRAFRHVAGDIDPALAGLGHALDQAAQRVAAAELPRELIAEVERRAAALGPRVMVRSSATVEDAAAGAAAGVFSSRAAVPLAQLWDAIRAVWTSALTPLAAAYARRRSATIAIGVIVQAYVEGEHATAYTRPPGEPAGDEVLLQRGGTLEHVARAEREDLVRAELAIDAAASGADVELVGTYLVQARPIVHVQPRALVPAPPVVLAPLQDGRVWTWDVTHNPDPLSVAQQELVALVADLGPYELRLCAGYLYATPREIAAPVRDAETIEAELERLLANPPLDLDAALACYRAFYAIWAGELNPLVAATRPTVPASRPSAIEATLVAAARGKLPEAEVIERLGQLAPAWDVAAPTFAERPGLLRDAIARAGTVSTSRVEIAAHPVADLAERDDLLFARAQWMVRRALLARAGELGLSVDDVFWLRFADLQAPIDPDEARRRAGASRAAAERAARWQMPIVVGGAPAAPAEPLRGVGTGPRITGRVVRFASLASAVTVGPRDVVVTRAVTPALAVLVAGCAALVSETGGLLDHGAALARELGIPCVVGCTDAWSQLADGMLVTVDGEAGVVTRT